MTIKLKSSLIISFILYASVIQAKTATEVFEIVSPSIVIIKTYDSKDKGKTLGSGVILEDSLVVTNCHVLEEAVTIKVKRQETEYSATLRHSDWDRDVCSLTVDGLLGQRVTRGSTNRLRVGDKVYVVGAPRGLELTLSDGLISSLRPVIGGQYLQITAPISPGSSGGGLFDIEGRLIGLPTFYLSEGQQLNFAVPVEWVNELPKRSTSAHMTGKTTTIEWFNKAIEFDKKKDWPGLLKYALSWTKKHPENVYAWTFLCIAYGESNQLTKAIKACRQAISIKPDHADAWYNLGSAYRESDQLAKAIEAYQQAIRIKPDHADAWGNLGIAYNRNNQLDKTIEAYRQTILITPEDDRVWYNLGIAYKESNQLDKAIEAFQKALFINPDDDDAWDFLGIIYLESNQLDKSIEAFQRSVNLDPDDAGHWLNLGIAYDKSHQRNEVMEVFNRLKVLDPELADQFFNDLVLP